MLTFNMYPACLTKPERFFVFPGIFFAIFMTFVFTQALPALAEITAPVNEIESDIEQFEIIFNSLENRFQNHENDEQVLIQIRSEASALLTELKGGGNQLKLEIVANTERLTALGEAPSDNTNPQAQTITVERNNLTETNAIYTVYVGRIEDIIISLEDIVFDIGILRRDMFTQALFKRVDLGDITFSELHTSSANVLATFQNKIKAWLGFVWDFKKRGLFISLILSGLAGFVIFFSGYRIFGRFIYDHDQQSELSMGRRLTSVFWSVAIPTLTAASFGASSYFLFQDFGVLRVDFAALFAKLIQAGVALVIVVKLSLLILSPWNSAERLVKVTNNGAKALFILIGFLLMIEVVGHIGVGIRGISDLPLHSSVAQSFLETMLIAIILIITSRIKPLLVDENSVDNKGKPWPSWISISLLLTGLFLIFTSFIGYVALAVFAASQIIIMASLLIIIYFGLLSAKSMMMEGAFANSPFGRVLARSFKLTENSSNNLGLFLGILVYIAILGLGLSFILLQWGLTSQEVLSAAYTLVTKLPIGGINISLINIVIGLFLFVIGYFVTRRFQHWLDQNVLARGKIETGVRSSIKKVIGYFGIAIAAMIGVSAAGFNLSNLALVAGALSLGIGFGLQTIVSNFVSGLIILVERPFEVGDWVETTSVQGIVKEISVRATEIETFSRKSILVPNSELVNSSVGNWTHRNPIGRIEVMIGVSYDNNPKKIIDILLEIANENQNILKNPEPSVEFVDFGASSLDFKVRGFLANIEDGLSIRNELRLTIYERFKAENIEIPYPHRDVYLHHVDQSKA